MIKLVQNNRRIVLILIDACAITISFFGAFLLRFDLSIPPEYLNGFTYLLPILLTSQILIFNFSGFYDVIWRFTSFWDMINIIKGVVIANIFGFLSFFFFQQKAIYSRSVLLIFILLNILIICFSRIAVRLFHSHFHLKKPISSETIKKRIILIGAGKTGEKITREIRNNFNSPFHVVGFVDDDISIQGSTLHGIKVIGFMKDLPNLSIEYDEILITAPSATGDKLRKIINICKQTGKRYKTVPSLSELMDKEVSLSTIRNVSYVDLLGREEVKLDMNSIEKIMFGKRILITGAGGSIGSELVRQCLLFKPSEIICIDNSEENIFSLEQELKTGNGSTILKYHLSNINELPEINKPFQENQPQIVFHAAAYKHVPIQELHPWSAVKTNVGGTLNLVNLSDKYDVKLFVLVSTDKAVNPVNVMGATKRTAEKVIQSFNKESKTNFMAVRFGNVLGSSGSAIPIFEKQIKTGGPLTITHPEMTRYFMSIQEASQLILQCAALGRQGEIFLLEMGKPIKILQMVKDLVRLSGLEPELDIPIVFTGLRPGEKLYEELQLKDEQIINTQHKKIMVLEGAGEIENWNSLKKKIIELLLAGEELNSDKIQNLLKYISPTYEPRLLKHMKNKVLKLRSELKIRA